MHTLDFALQGVLEHIGVVENAKRWGWKINETPTLEVLSLLQCAVNNWQFDAVAPASVRALAARAIEDGDINPRQGV